jgi:hypothetical protein
MEERTFDRPADPGSPMPWWRVGLVVGMAALLVGCNVIQYAFNRLDDWSVQRANEYLRLSLQEQSELRSRVEEFKAELLVRDFPAYERWLGDLDAVLSRGLEPDEATCLFSSLEEIYRHSAGAMARVAAETLAGSSRQRVDYLTKAIFTSNRDYRSEVVEVSSSRRLRDRQERFERSLKWWLGSLDADQTRLIRQRVGAMPDLGIPWYRMRRAAQSSLIVALKAGATADELEPLLRSWWAEPDWSLHGHEAEHLRWRQDVVQLLVDLRATLNARQRKQLRDRVADLRADIAGLLRQAPSRIVLELGGATCA